MNLQVKLEKESTLSLKTCVNQTKAGKGKKNEGVEGENKVRKPPK